MRRHSKLRKANSPNRVFNSAYLGLTLSAIYLAFYVFIGGFSHDRKMALACFIGILVIFSAIGFIRFLSTVIEQPPH